MNLTDLHTFSLVAETGTITGAAKRLGVPKSTVSRRVRRLEAQLGHDLLRRSSRSVALTENGQALFQRSQPPLQELHAAVATLEHSRSEPVGKLRISTVPGFGQSLAFVSCLESYSKKYPKTTVDLYLSSRTVNLVEEGFDIALRLHSRPLPDDSMLMSRRLLPISRGMYGSPEYLSQMGMPEHPSDLTEHRIAAHSIVDLRTGGWLRQKGRGSPEDRLPEPLWTVNDSAALERFATSGAGLALLTTMEGDGLAAQGRLKRVLPEYEALDGTASLVWPTSRHLAPRVRAFIDHAIETFGTAS